MQKPYFELETPARSFLAEGVPLVMALVFHPSPPTLVAAGEPGLRAWLCRSSPCQAWIDDQLFVTSYHFCLGAVLALGLVGRAATANGAGSRAASSLHGRECSSILSCLSCCIQQGPGCRLSPGHLLSPSHLVSLRDPPARVSLGSKRAEPMLYWREGTTGSLELHLPPLALHMDSG